MGERPFSALAEKIMTLRLAGPSSDAKDLMKEHAASGNRVRVIDLTPRESGVSGPLFDACQRIRGRARI